MIHGLSDVVKQSCPASQGLVESQLGSHDARHVGDFKAVSQSVLPVAAAEAERTDDLYEIRVHLLDVGFEKGFFACVDDHLVHILLRLLDEFFDSGRMDPAVRNEPFEGKTGNLAPDRVKAADRDGLGRIVYDEVNTGQGLESTDVASFAADDAALHVVPRQGDGTDGHLGSVLDGTTLNGRHHDLASLFLGFPAGFLLQFLQAESDAVICILLHFGQQKVLGLFSGQGSDLL